MQTDSRTAGAPRANGEQIEALTHIGVDIARGFLLWRMSKMPGCERCVGTVKRVKHLSTFRQIAHNLSKACHPDFKERLGDGTPCQLAVSEPNTTQGAQ